MTTSGSPSQRDARISAWWPDQIDWMSGLKPAKEMAVEVLPSGVFAGESWLNGAGFAKAGDGEGRPAHFRAIQKFEEQVVPLGARTSHPGDAGQTQGRIWVGQCRRGLVVDIDQIPGDFKTRPFKGELAAGEFQSVTGGKNEARGMAVGRLRMARPQGRRAGKGNQPRWR